VNGERHSRISERLKTSASVREHPAEGTTGRLYNWIRPTLLVLFCVATTIASSAQTFTSLTSFDGANGIFPETILQGPDGALWGTTANGGPKNCGTVFKMTAAGVLTTVFTFSCTNGSEPTGLILGTDGNFYGTTFFGGANNSGEVFKLTPGGVLTILASFTGQGGEGTGPLGNLAEGTDGNFYGATYGGGTASSYGTFFKITLTGKLSTLYQFDFTHGAQPYSGPVVGSDGSFYGTTYSGGQAGLGTIYKITPKGALTVLHVFEVTAEGFSPISGLVQGKDGNFYGTTPNGGSNSDGTAFKVTPSGTFTSLHSFAETDGRSPGGTLVQATDGNFYGGTGYGGTNDIDGTIFKMTAAGVVTTVHDFNGTDGNDPFPLVQDTNGSLFGTTGGGGDLNCQPTYGCGTVFSLSVGLGAFVETLPAIGKMGTKVTILGTNLTGSTGVSFNGTAAAFTVVSNSQITTTVPTGATTGTVEVVTPKKTLKSNAVFHILR
jgi:uncharacterized repeat protein (TIGR03803 family)